MALARTMQQLFSKRGALLLQKADFTLYKNQKIRELAVHVQTRLNGEKPTEMSSYEDPGEPWIGIKSDLKFISELPPGERKEHFEVLVNCILAVIQAAKLSPFPDKDEAATKASTETGSTKEDNDNTTFTLPIPLHDEIRRLVWRLLTPVSMAKFNILGTVSTLRLDMEFLAEKGDEDSKELAVACENLTKSLQTMKEDELRDFIQKLKAYGDKARAKQTTTQEQQEQDEEKRKPLPLPDYCDCFVALLEKELARIEVGDVLTPEEKYLLCTKIGKYVKLEELPRNLTQQK